MVKDMKIRILGREHSEAVQEALFAEGIYWWADTSGIIQLTDAGYLFVFNNHIGYATSEIYFNQDPRQEHWLIDGALKSSTEAFANYQKPTEQLPVGLRPKWVVDELRRVEILEAMLRYASANPPVATPGEWLLELDELSDIQRPSQEI